MRVLRPVCSRRRLDTNYNVASTPSSRDHPEQSNKRRMPMQTSEVLMSDSHAHSPCRQHACAHAPSGRMQSSGTGFPLLPRWARFPMWNRDSLHARNSRVLSWNSITRRQAAGAYHQNLPLPAPPSHPSTFPGASLAEAAIRTTRRWDSSRGIISACICLHLPAPPCISNRRHRRQSRRSSRRQSSCHAALITAPYGLMSSVRHRPPSAQPSRARRGRCSLQISHRRAAASR